MHIGRELHHVSPYGDSFINVKRGDDIISFKNQKIAIKIDVEGHEMQVLDGLEKVMRENKCVLQIESYKFKENTKNILLKACGKQYKYLGSLPCEGNSIPEHDHYLTNF